MYVSGQDVHSIKGAVIRRVKIFWLLFNISGYFQIRSGLKRCIIRLVKPWAKWQLESHQIQKEHETRQGKKNNSF